MLPTYLDIAAAFLIAFNLEAWWSRGLIAWLAGAGISIAFSLGMAEVDLEPAAYALRHASEDIVRNSVFIWLCVWGFGWVRAKV